MSEYQYYEFLANFQNAFQRVMVEHRRRRALVERLVRAGLWRVV